jgi:hypothetical protein
MYRYEAKLDSLARMLTVVIFLVMIFPISTMIIGVQKGHWELLIIIAVLAVILLLCQLYRPQFYTLDAEGLHIHRQGGAVNIPFSTIAEVKFIDKKDLGFGWRTIGVGGFWGYYGNFKYKSIGNATLYATNMDKIVLLKTTEGKTILITPEDMADFLNRIHQMMKKK